MLRRAAGEGFRLVYGKKQLQELIDVLGYARIARKYKVRGVEIERFVRWIAKRGKRVEAVKVEMCRDSDDNYIIGLAMAVAKKGKVFLVTGDKDILTLKGKITGVKIVTSGEFLGAVDSHSV